MTVVDEIKQEAELTEELTKMMYRHAVMYETIHAVEASIMNIAKEYVENGTQESEFVQTIDELFETATNDVMFDYESKIRYIKEALNR